MLASACTPAFHADTLASRSLAAQGFSGTGTGLDTGFGHAGGLQAGPAGNACAFSGSRPPMGGLRAPGVRVGPSHFSANFQGRPLEAPGRPLWGAAGVLTPGARQRGLLEAPGGLWQPPTPRRRRRRWSRRREGPTHRCQARRSHDWPDPALGQARGELRGGRTCPLEHIQEPCELARGCSRFGA